MLSFVEAIIFFHRPKENIMQTLEWLKPGLYGAACGAAALAVIGFSWGGWVTGGTARTMAADQSKAEVVTALSLICVDQSKRDPQLAERVAAIKTASSWNRGDLVLKNGWATMPGTAEGNSQVAKDCADKIAA
jgi:dienelactone hydrolase